MTIYDAKILTFNYAGDKAVIDDKTTAKTLWSDTLIDMLVSSLRANKSDKQIKGLLLECKQKGFKASYLTGKIRKELDDAAASRVKRLM